MMTSKDRKGPKPSRRFIESPVRHFNTHSNPPKPMTNQPKRLHIYKPEDVRGNITGPFIRLTLGHKNHFLGLELNERFIGISLIFRHIVFSFKPQ